MANFYQKYKLSVFEFIFSTILLIIIHLYNIDVFELIISTLNKFENYEFDEFILYIITFGVFIYFDLLRREKHFQIETEKNKIYKAMLLSMHHILNNFLNQMQLFKITAEEFVDFPKDIIEHYNEIEKEALEQMRLIKKIDDIDEKNIIESIKPK